MGNKTCKIAIQLFLQNFNFFVAKQVAHFVLLILLHLSVLSVRLVPCTCIILHVGHVGAYDNMANLLYKHH